MRRPGGLGGPLYMKDWHSACTHLAHLTMQETLIIQPSFELYIPPLFIRYNDNISEQSTRFARRCAWSSNAARAATQDRLRA
jgi:hypothetical protein